MKVKRGDCVKYIGSCREQVSWGNNSDHDGILVKGKEYVVADTEVHTSHTKLILSGYNGKYNSISFMKCG